MNDVTYRLSRLITLLVLFRVGCIILSSLKVNKFASPLYMVYYFELLLLFSDVVHIIIAEYHNILQLIVNKCISQDVT